MKVTHKISLDMAFRGVAPRIDAVQGDTNSRVLEVTLYSGGHPWEVPAGVSVAIGYHKPDGTAGVYDTLPDETPAVSVSGNVVSVTLAPQLLSVSGVTVAHLLFHDADLNRLGSYPILICVSQGLGDAPESADFYSYPNLDAINEALSLHDSKIIDGWRMDEQGYLYLLAKGEAVVGPIGPFVASGGGGGGGNSYAVTLSNLSDSRVITVPEGQSVVLKLKYSSVDSDGMDDGPGIGQVLVGGIVKQTFSAKQGEFELDVTAYLTAGTNNVAVRVTNSENVSKTMTYTVTVAAVSLTSSFDASQPCSGAISFPFTPVGLAEKKVHFELDGAELGTMTVTTSGRQVSFPIPAQSHGAHTLRVWFTCNIEGTDIFSNTLYYNLICTEEGNTTPIIALTSPPVSSVEQYASLVRKYRVYDPGGLTAAITLEANGETVASLTVDRTEQTWTYQPTQVGELEQTVRCGDAFISWTQTVTESSVQVEAETEALALYLSSYGRSNKEANPARWEWGGVSARFTGFNFTSDGWLQDEEDNTVLRLTGDARLEIPYKLFAYDFRTTGKTLEFEFATREVLNYDAEIIRCYSGGRGFVLTAQQLLLKSEQSGLSIRYKEDEHIRVSFVVEKRSERRLILCYVNGVLSAAAQYPEDDDFSQAEPVGISIGSNECTVDLYTVRAYDNSLTRYQILDNWIADTRNIQRKIDRYKRNQVYNAYGQIVIDKLPTDLPYQVLQGEALPQFKGDKKVIDDYFKDLLDPERSYSSTGTQIDVQGTSSQYYPIKNYKLSYKNGFVLYDGSHVTAYAMNEDAIPVAVFTMKADFASSESAYNVVSAKLYNELCPYRLPSMEEDKRIRYSIDGFPTVIFRDNQFLGKYNFNNDKGTPEPFGLKAGDERWEVLQNGTDRVGFHSADFSGDSWKEDFEGNFPDGNTDTTRLQAMCAWVTSTDTQQATFEAIEPVTYEGMEYTADTAEYRLAKFSQELPDWFVEEAVIFYYLYTLLLLCMDQREKNVLWRYDSQLQRWLADYYDADSILGHNNQAQPVLDYWLEDTDHTESGDPVFNGQGSTFWKNLRATRWPEIKAMYQELRSSGQLSYEKLISALESHQAKWPEAIFNEDMATKYLGDNLSYLNFLRGKKELWNKWWLYNRLRYMDTLFEAGTSKEKQMTVRVNVKENIRLTPYMNMYGRVYFNALEVTQRMERGREYEFQWAASGAEDPVVGINDIDLLTSLGDLSPHMVELIDISGAKRLTSLKLGDGAEDYVNYSLTSVTLGASTMLRRLDLRNCPNLAHTVDASFCTNIEEIYLEGTSVPGCTLPNGGVLKVLQLPGSVTNLTVRNQGKLTDFSCPDYSHISTLRVENTPNIPTADIILAMADGGRVRLTGLDWTLDTPDILEKLVKMRGITEDGSNTDLAVLSGRLHFTCQLPISTYLQACERFPYLEVTCAGLTLDVLAESTGKLFRTADNKLFKLLDGGHTASVTGEEIDTFISR